MQKRLSDGFRKSFFRKTAPLRYLRNQMHPDGYGMPMRKGEIAVLFNGMSQRMPQIQQLPQTGIEFILIHLYQTDCNIGAVVADTLKVRNDIE